MANVFFNDCALGRAPGTSRQPFILQSVSSPVRYKYILSLPERAVRSLGALSGGLLREIGNVALPASVRRTTLYRTMVEVALRFLIEEVGQVEGVYPSEGRLAENFILKRTANVPLTFRSGAATSAPAGIDLHL